MQPCPKVRIANTFIVSILVSKVGLNHDFLHYRYVSTWPESISSVYFNGVPNNFKQKDLLLGVLKVKA